MMRNLICTALVLLALCLPVRAAESVPVQVDGYLLEGPAFLEDGVTYVPLRELLDALGGWDLRWDAASRTAVSDALGLSADPDANLITVGGTSRPGTVEVWQGRTYVPLRLVSEALGASACWDPWMRGAAVTSPDASCDAMDFYWLSRVIFAESGGEPLEGQIAVGNVVLNRVDHEQFPDSVPAVVFDCADAVQFEPVANGTIYQTPSDSAMEAARRALDGENTAGDALYFYAPALSQGAWVNASRTFELAIGCHRFYS